MNNKYLVLAISLLSVGHVATSVGADAAGARDEKKAAAAGDSLVRDDVRAALAAAVDGSHRGGSSGGAQPPRVAVVEDSEGKGAEDGGDGALDTAAMLALLGTDGK